MQLRRRFAWTGLAIMVSLSAVLCAGLAASLASARQAMMEPISAEMASDVSSTPPLLGWSSVSWPQPVSHLQVTWIRFVVPSAELGSSPYALVIDQLRGSLSVYLNGKPLVRDDAAAAIARADASLPYLVAIPDPLLMLGNNELAMRLEPVPGGGALLNGVGIGQLADVRERYNRQYLVSFLAPLLGNAILAAITMIAGTGWLLWRREASLGWLALIGASWIARNFHYLPLPLPLSDGIAWIADLAMLYILIFAMLAFAVSFFSPPNAKMWMFAAGSAALLMAGLGIVLQSQDFTEIVGLASAGGALAVLAAVTFLAKPQTAKVEIVLVSAALALAVLVIALDICVDARLWPGFGIRLSAYASVIATGACGLAIIHRMLEGAAARENLNIMLGQRIETTKANLLASESARRSLEISNAVTRERERMMQEIHDGIGSSLVAALASAERQGKQSTTAVVALKSALADLRIAVDSLEPVEGNVTALLASLRYRVEPELKKSGIAIEWMVDDVPELEWLDSPNALHILRIFQESLGNTLGHANASKVRVTCKMNILDGRPGIRVEVSDDGEGFDLQAPARGRGRRNMMDRAEALGGKLTIQSAPGSGSKTTLWLPLLRKKI